MPKPGIHPPYHSINIKIGEDVFETMSCCKKKEYVLDKDFRKHPAWTKKNIFSVDKSSSNVNKYNEKYGDLGF